VFREPAVEGVDSADFGGCVRHQSFAEPTGDISEEAVSVRQQDHHGGDFGVGLFVTDEEGTDLGSFWVFVEGSTVWFKQRSLDFDIDIGH
jgi:hypothetical protein